MVVGDGDPATFLRALQAPTPVIGGARDPFYSADLLRETARGNPRARLVPSRRRRHVPGGEDVPAQIRRFLEAT